MSLIDVLCPDLGNFKDVAVIDVLVRPGDVIAADAPLVTLETDKATMDVPSSVGGEVLQVLVTVGGKVSQGTLLARIETRDGAAAEPTQVLPAMAAVPGAAAVEALTAVLPAAVVAAAGAAPTPAVERAMAAAPAVLTGSGSAGERTAQLLVLGAGPGGYTAAFRAADLGLRVTLVDRRATLGGVCLNVGCIPSKALLHAARVLDEAQQMAGHGISFGKAEVDVARLRAWKASVVKKLTGGLSLLAKQRKVEVVRGVGQFAGPQLLAVNHEGTVQHIRFEQCIIAAGSEPVKLPFIPDDPRIMDSTGALELPDRRGRLLVVGGGIIGLEMASVYEALGARVSIVELTGQLIPGCDPDLVRPLERRLKSRYEQILLNTRVTAVEARQDALHVSFEGPQGVRTEAFDRALIAVGRVPNGHKLGAEAAGVQVDERGYVRVDSQMRTSAPHIFAIGDVVGQPMLAHKATHEGKVAAEVAAGHRSHFDARAIPAVAYTDPEVAWAGLTESQAREQGIAIEKGAFPWMASGRSLSLGRDEGLTKLIFDPATRRVLGGGIVGSNAGELIAEVVLAIEMGADAMDLALTVHPHPTLSETVCCAAEAFAGTLTDLYLPKKPARPAG
ncbi:MAG: dihydrolipoyl dehydrogenase [Gammaproteobacteria bacterium]|nr:dihydrolipoyl dehydrogenase [Gammaproteobacteria bacterium]